MRNAWLDARALLIAAVAGALAAVLVGVSWPAPSATVTASPCPSVVTYSPDMVPSCGVLWGGTGSAFEPTPAPVRHRRFEALSGRELGVYHAYYRGDALFPTAEDIALLHEPGSPRMLMANWKVADKMTWADVAAGRADDRIDAWARYVMQEFPDRFFLTLHHEPEDDVDPRPGSGMTPVDYRDMFRHTIQRLRADRVDNAIVVWNTTGFSDWLDKPWFETLYPGDDVVDWVAWDPYVRPRPGVTADLETLVNQATGPSPDGSTFPGTYDYMMSHHGNKPFMLAEFGFQRPVDQYGAQVEMPSSGPGSPADFFARVAPQLDEFPNIKAMLYFDTDGDIADLRKDPPTNVDETPQSLRAWRTLNADPRLLNPPASASRAAAPTGRHSALVEDLLNMVAAASRVWSQASAAAP